MQSQAGFFFYFPWFDDDCRNAEMLEFSYDDRTCIYVHKLFNVWVTKMSFTKIYCECFFGFVLKIHPVIVVL